MPDGRYCMTYCSQEGPAGIKIAFSNHINRGYQYQPQQIDAEKGSCEAPTMYKLIGQQKWILMQDCYSMEPHNFYFCETTDLEHFTPLGYFDDGQCPMHRTNFSEQKHGAVVQVTKKELMKLIQYWNK
jgi:hypothetical protein